MLTVRPEMVSFTMESRQRDEPKPAPCGPKIDEPTFKAMHDAEALTGTPLSEWRKTLGGEVPHVDFDESRNMWRAWLNVEGVDPGYERAKISGEWTTRLGAIRRLRNHVPAPSPQGRDSAAPSQKRPEPGGGSTSMLDSLAERRKHAPRGIGGTIKYAISMAAYALAAIVVVLGLVLGLWEGFVRDAVTPRRAPAVVVRPVAAPEPAAAPATFEEPAPPLLPRRRATR